MPKELDARERRFVQEYLIDLDPKRVAIAAGYSASVAHVKSFGWVSDRSSKPHVLAAVRIAMDARAKRTEITADRVLQELAKIGFSDIRKVVSWRGSLVRESDNPDGGDVLVIKEIVTNHVQVVDSDQVDDETAAAISEVSQSKEGLKIKLHSKPDALDKLGRHLGLFKDKVEHSGPNGGPIELEDVSDRERARAMLLLATKAKSKA